MLFLLNDRLIEIETPEARIMGRWREIGCGDPRQLRAHDAVEFVKTRMHVWMEQTSVADENLLKDMAALIIAKTGANSLILKPAPDGLFEARLRDVPPLVLETYRSGAANDQDQRLQA